MPCRSYPSTNWTLRNNSDNVSAVLRSKFYTQNSDDDDETRHKCTKYSSKGGNNCYCHDNPIRPKLFFRPSSCICVNSPSPPPKPKVKKNYATATKITKIGTPCKFLINQYESNKEKLDKNQVRSRINFFERYDNSRIKKAMQNSTICAVKSAARCVSAANSESSSIISSTKKYPSVANSSKAATCCTCCTRTCSCCTKATRAIEEKQGQEDEEEEEGQEDEEKEELAVPSLKDLREFRDEHYFETHHAPEELVKIVPEHICVHRFELDERELPKPLNCDVYGESRCRICEKPMEHNVKTLEKKKKKEKKEEKGSFPSYYKYGLAPKKVYMGSGNVRMEVIAEVKDEEEKWEKNKKALRNFEYANTCALRFQKGVV